MIDCRASRSIFFIPYVCGWVADLLRDPYATLISQYRYDQIAAKQDPGCGRCFAQPCRPACPCSGCRTN